MKKAIKSREQRRHGNRSREMLVKHSIYRTLGRGDNVGLKGRTATEDRQFTVREELKRDASSKRHLVARGGVQTGQRRLNRILQNDNLAAIFLAYY